MLAPFLCGIPTHGTEKEKYLGLVDSLSLFPFSNQFDVGDVGAICPMHSRQHRGLDNVQRCTEYRRCIYYNIVGGKKQVIMKSSY